MNELLTPHETVLVERLIENTKNEKVCSVGTAPIEEPYTWSEKFLSYYLDKIKIQISREIVLMEVKVDEKL